jgi:hypothetical protein
MGVGFGISSAPVTESIMGSLPPSRAGVGSAVNDTTRQTGGALGVAVIGSIFAARYHHEIGNLSFLPAGVRETARESIGTSLEVGRRLGGPIGDRLHHVGTEAFLGAMRVTYVVSVLIIVLAMGVAYRYLPARAAEPIVLDTDDARPAAPAVGAELGEEGPREPAGPDPSGPASTSEQVRGPSWTTARE